MKVKYEYYAATWEEIGQSLGISRERARQIFNVGMAKLQVGMRRRMGMPVDVQAEKAEQRRQKQLAHVRAWTARNREYMRKKRREWARKNRAKVKAQHAAWAEKNREHVNAMARENYAKRRKNGTTSV